MADARERLASLRRMDELRNKAGFSTEDASISMAQPKQDFSLTERFVGAMDAALGLGSEVLASIPNMTVGGVAAMGDASLRQLSGYGDPLGRSEELVDKGTESLVGAKIPTYTPKTDAGKQTMESASFALNLPFAFLEKTAKKIQDKQIENARMEAKVSGESYKRPSAMAPVAVQTLPDIIASVMGFPGTKMLKRAKDLRQLDAKAEGLGIDMGAPYEEQVKQASAAGGKYSGSGMEGMENLPARVKAVREAERARIGQIFQEGREAGATVSSRQAGTLRERANSALEGMTVNDLPTVERAMTEIDALGLPARGSLTELMGKRNSAQTKINDIMEARMNINRDLPSDITSREYKALSSVKGELDAFLQEAFEKDMVNGSPQAIKRWQEGFKEWGEFKGLFDEDRTIRNIWKGNLSAEEVKRMIYNKSAVNPGADAGPLVRSLKTILGDDAREIKTLRMTVLDDLTYDLTKRDPDLKAFTRKWEKFRYDNPTLVKELFPEQMVDEIESLADFSYAIEGEAPPNLRKQLSIPRIASVFALGHGIARGAARVAFGQRIASALLDPSRKAAISKNVLGYNPRASMIPNDRLYRMGLLEMARESEEETTPQ